DRRGGPGRGARGRVPVDEGGEERRRPEQRLQAAGRRAARGVAEGFGRRRVDRPSEQAQLGGRQGQRAAGEGGQGAQLAGRRAGDHQEGRRRDPQGGGEEDRADQRRGGEGHAGDRKSTRLNFSHVKISYAVFCLKKKK